VAAKLIQSSESALTNSVPFILSRDRIRRAVQSLAADRKHHSSWPGCYVKEAGQVFKFEPEKFRLAALGPPFLSFSFKVTVHKTREHIETKINIYSEKLSQKQMASVTAEGKQ
jgi:hypothetical protein